MILPYIRSITYAIGPIAHSVIYLFFAVNEMALHTEKGNGNFVVAYGKCGMTIPQKISLRNKLRNLLNLGLLLI